MMKLRVLKLQGVGGCGNGGAAVVRLRDQDA